MALTEKEKKILHYMFGEWEYKKDDFFIHILIRAYPSKIELNYNGEKEEFGSSGDWWGDNYFYFNQFYFVRHADENTMIFGKNTTGTVGTNNDWEEVFTRIK